MSTWRERRIESAAIDVVEAQDAYGQYVNLCAPLDKYSVADAIANLITGFEPGSCWLHQNGAYTAAMNIRKLATLLEAHYS